ncbi:MAG: hypothetical protein M0P57_08635 [Syntrophales bacterium]|jgi:hypothetical protein|nr:hypothetical protein [Syntrophales bacterium]MDY0044132.1 hypothetical protein [Syntrophales bacterium]
MNASVRLFHGLSAVSIAALLVFVSSFSLLAQGKTEMYIADLKPLNARITGSTVSGKAAFEINGDKLSIYIEATGLTPGIMHLQHYHGITDGTDANCPTMEQDRNNDGILDLIETRFTAGVTLVPFHDDPSSLKIQVDTYPVASKDGTITYNKTVSIEKLKKAVLHTYGISEFHLENRVVFLHGISPEINLPSSVMSLTGVPAHVTIPVACGKIYRLK